MATTAGALTLVSVQATTASVSSAVATAGTAPYTYQWYRSTTTGFSPGAGNLIAGATALTLNDTGLIPNTIYYYKVRATDSGSVTGDSSQLVVTTLASSLSQNQFQQLPTLGAVDLRFAFNSVSVQIDVSQATALWAGSAVKMVDSADGVPKVIGCTANTDVVLGFINFDIKNVSFVAGNYAEISMGGNVMYLYATTAIARSAQVTLDVTSPGGVGVLVPSSGAEIVGWAYDKATAPGQLIRIFVRTPTFSVA